MAKILILEDDPDRVQIFRLALDGQHEIMHADNAAEAIKLINSEPFEVIFLDHDLGGKTFVAESDKNTGSEVVRHLALNCGGCFRVPIIIHSMNIPAAVRMQDELVDSGYRNVHRIPFSKLVDYLDDPGFIV